MIDLVWGDGEHKFDLPIAQLRELQEKCDAGPADILARLVLVHPAVFGRGAPLPENYQGIDAEDLFRVDTTSYFAVRGLGSGWRVDDVIEVIRLGLIGGGKSPAEAYSLVDRYIVKRPQDLADNRQTAAIVLTKALVGDPSDPVGEPPAEMPTQTQTGASNSPPSTPGEP